MEILGLVFSFVLFLLVLNKGYLATLNPLSLIIVIAISLVAGYALVSLLAFLFQSALKLIVIVVLIGLVICIFR